MGEGGGGGRNSRKRIKTVTHVGSVRQTVSDGAKAAADSPVASADALPPKIAISHETGVATTTAQAAARTTADSMARTTIL